jgi:TPR repeat protein
VTRGRLRARPVAGAEAEGRVAPRGSVDPASTPAGFPSAARSDSDPAFSDATAAFELGWTLAETDDLAGAEAAFLRADRLGHPAGATNLGVLLEQRGDLAGAKAAYRRADERGDATGAFNLGSLLAEQGDLVAAENAFRRADERGDPELTDRAHAALAELHGLRAS